MPVITMDAVVDLAYGAGFRGESLAMAGAVARAESSLNTEARGDVGLQTEKWGPSVGLWQIRTLKAERGKGTDRDELALADPGRQARAAYNISGGGNNWRPWSVFTSGAFRRFLDEARTAAGVRTDRGGSGSTASAPSAKPTASRSADVILPVGSLPTAFVAPRLTAGIMLHGANGVEGVGDFVLGGSVDLTVEETSEVQIRLANTGRVLFGRGQGVAGIGTRMRWGDLDLRVADLDLSPARGGSDFTMIARERSIQELKRTNGKGGSVPGGVHKDTSPTEYAQRQAQRTGLRFVGEGSARHPEIAATLNDSGLYESPWAVLHRLARDLAYLCFVSAGVLYFGRPSWIVNRTTGVKVAAFSPELGGAFVGWWGDRDTDTLEIPRFHETEDPEAEREGRFPFSRTLSFRLPRWRGELVRPGMRVELAGLQGIPDRWLVTRVGWPIDNGLAPVEVDCVEPVDPPLNPEKTGKTAELDGSGEGPTQRSSGSAAWKWPTYGRVSSEFGPRSGRVHKGIDIAAPTGRPIRAARAGTVTRAGVSSSYGNVVYLDHGDGHETRYAHQHRLNVRKGQRVDQGDQLGEVGSTGRSTGPHLHYEILRNGVAVNPRSLHAGEP
jgi:murein DD-endopeptidase MepM/ murein hydrolase activator NlpD